MTWSSVNRVCVRMCASQTKCRLVLYLVLHEASSLHRIKSSHQRKTKERTIEEE
ncbi:hypothetical protein DsansV1_C28g0205421 [Dioscorea sansibarensis]